jgi:hypothetical protein
MNQNQKAEVKAFLVHKIHQGEVNTHEELRRVWKFLAKQQYPRIKEANFAARQKFELPRNDKYRRDYEDFISSKEIAGKVF